MKLCTSQYNHETDQVDFPLRAINFPRPEREAERAEPRDVDADLPVPLGLRGRDDRLGRQQHDRDAQWKNRSGASGEPAIGQYRWRKRR